MPHNNEPDRDRLLASGGLGGLAASALPAIGVVGHTAGQEIVSCPERRHTRGAPPYDVDDDVAGLLHPDRA